MFIVVQMRHFKCESKSYCDDHAVVGIIIPLLSNYAVSYRIR